MEDALCRKFMVGGDDSGEKRYIEVEFRVQTPMWGLLTYVSRLPIVPSTVAIIIMQYSLSLESACVGIAYTPVKWLDSCLYAG
jgi:hypothetical protein